MRPSTLQRVCFVGACVVLAYTGRVAWAEAPVGTGWNIRCFKPSNAIASFAQDTTGTVWFGSQAGLNAMDGWQQTIAGRALLAVTPSLGPRIAVSANDVMWVAMGSGFLRANVDNDGLQIAERGNPYLVRVVGDKQTRFTTAEGLPSDHVWAVHVARDGTVWAGTEDGLARFHDGRFVPVPQANALQSMHVLALASNAANDLWIGTTLGLARLRADKLEVIFAHEGVETLAVDEKRGLVWASTPNGVVAVDGLHVVRKLSGDRGLPSSNAAALLIDHDQKLWVGTARGLALVDPDSAAPAEVFRPSNGLPDNRVQSLFEDREGGVWVGTRVGGACRITPKALWDLDATNGLEAESIFSIVRAQDGSLWISSSSQIARFRNGRVVEQWQPTLPANAELRALTEAPDGSVWVTTTAAQLIHLRASTARSSQHDLALVALPEKEFRNGQRTILFDPRGRIWLGRRGGGLLHARSNGNLAASETWHLVGYEDGVCEGETTAAYIGNDNRTLWFGTEGGGATRWDDKGAQCLTTKQGLGTNYVTSFFEDPSDGAVWIGTRNDSGLARYRQGHISRVQGHQGLYCDSIAGLVPDANRNLWTLCGAGVGRTRLADLNAVADGKSSFAMTLAFASERSWETTVGTSPTGAIDESGKLWWATLGGASVIDPPANTSLPFALTPKISSVAIAGQSIPIAKEIETRSLDPHVLFRFATPSFLDPARTVFRHRMEPLDTQWRPAFKNFVAYPKLGPGTYRLFVGVSDGFGGWSNQEATMLLHVRRPFHRTVWFWSAVVMFMALLALAAVKLRERTLRVRHAAMLQERTRIARDLHDVIGQAFAGIGLLLDAIRTTRSTAVEPVQEIANRAREILDHCDGNIRTAIWELRQRDDQYASLAQLATQVIEETQRALQDAGPSIRLRVGSTKTQVSELIRHELPHVLREALSNAIKHARSRSIVVHLEEGESELTMTVQDDGQGFAEEGAATAAGHFGILGMHERARRMAAHLSFERPLGGGTVVRLRVPLSQHSAGEPLV